MNKKVKLLIFATFFQLQSVQRLPWCDQYAMIEFVRPFLPHNPVIIDAGSYDGRETVTMKRTWPDSTIYSFEPVPELYQKLKKNTNGLANVHCFPLALSDKNGFAEFHLSEESQMPGVVSMSSSLLAPKEHLRCNPDTLFKYKIEVPTITLNEWTHLYDIPKIDFLWFDMQGYELNVLKTIPTDILNKIKVIVTEVEFVEAYEGQYLYNDIKIWLEEKGFVLVARNFDIPPSKDHWFGDAIFVRKN